MINTMLLYHQKRGERMKANLKPSESLELWLSEPRSKQELRNKLELVKAVLKSQEDKIEKLQKKLPDEKMEYHCLQVDLENNYVHIDDIDTMREHVSDAMRG